MDKVDFGNEWNVNRGRGFNDNGHIVGEISGRRCLRLFRFFSLLDDTVHQRRTIEGAFHGGLSI